ncbi:MAG: D-alanyl-D-alanine carboxypeptidase/D-alanyl-D-alanine endopeptidase [Aureispira sp.]
MWRYGVLCCFLFSSLTAVWAQNTLELALQTLEQDPALKHASISFCAIDVNSNTIYAQRNANTSLAPASSMKVITTGAALATLGPDYTFKTHLEYSGSISNGTLRGNLYLRGMGDPSLGSPIMEGVLDRATFMKKLVTAVQKAGIQRIEGTVIGDGSYFEDQIVVPTWQWGDVGNHYGAGVSGLNYHDNLYYIYFGRTNTFGDIPKVDHTDPVIPGLALDNRVTQAGSRTGDNAYVFSAPFGQQAIIRGTIPKGSGLFDIKGATPDPSLLCAHDLRNALINQGISVAKIATTQRQFKRQERRQNILTHSSPQLHVICKHTNEASRNMYCEAMLKAMGAKVKGTGTTDNGIAVVMDLWRGRGLELSGFFMKDGCGLSARNGVTAKTFAAIMRKMYLDKASFGDFYNQLAIAGRTGTLRNVGRNSLAENNVRAKSGSMNRIRSYTGYVTTKSGKLLSFSILVNNYSCTGYRMRKKLETLLIAMAETN